MENYKNYYTLRPGDFRVERLEDIYQEIGFKYVGIKAAIDRLAQDHSLFLSEAEAKEASMLVRSQLASLAIAQEERRLSASQTRRPQHSIRLQLGGVLVSVIPPQDTPSHCDTPQEPT